MRLGAPSIPDREHRHLGVARLERAVATAAEWSGRPRSVSSTPAGGETSSSPAFGFAQCRPGPLEGVGLVEQARSPLVRQPSSAGANRSSSPSRRATASSASRKSTISAAVEPSSRRASSRGFPAAAAAGRPCPARFDAATTHLARRRRTDGSSATAPVDPGLAVIRADHHRVALQELVGPARGLEERADRRVAARERLLCRLRAQRVRGEVVVGQVVDEEVEAVAGHEPAPDEPAYSSIEPAERRTTETGAPVTSDSKRL